MRTTITKPNSGPVGDASLPDVTMARAGSTRRLHRPYCKSLAFSACDSFLRPLRISVAVETSSPISSARCRFIAALLLAHLLAVLALAASPRLHAWLHPGEADDDDDCAVVLFMHGTIDGAAAAPVVVAALIALATVFVATPKPKAFVLSVFARGRVFEHAPPAAA